MGIKLFGSSSWCSCDAPVDRDPPPVDLNPNPLDFKIKKIDEINNYIIVLVNYPNCNNYEGNKILVFKGETLSNILNSTAIDPHFCDNVSHASPVARFEPTDRGWNWARQFCSYCC